MIRHEHLPLRQIARLRGEMYLALGRTGDTLFADQGALNIEYALVARLCLPDWRRGDGLAPPAAPGGAITIRQIATSLGGPAETVRRRVRTLIDRDLLVATPAGVSLATSPAGAAFAQTYFRTVHDHFVRLIEDVATTCDCDLPVGATRQWTVHDVIERAIDAMLLAVDTYRLPLSLLTFAIWGALTAFAVRDITYDPVLCRRYAIAIPPDHLRRDISLRRLGDVMRLPYTTVWRHVRTLSDKGMVTRLGPDRWSVYTANLRQDDVRPLAGTPNAITLRRIRELTLMGLDPGRAGDCYLLGRPAPVDFGEDGGAG